MNNRIYQCLTAFAVVVFSLSALVFATEEDTSTDPGVLFVWKKSADTITTDAPVDGTGYLNINFSMRVSQSTALIFKETRSSLGVVGSSGNGDGTVYGSSTDNSGASQVCGGSGTATISAANVVTAMGVVPDAATGCP